MNKTSILLFAALAAAAPTAAQTEVADDVVGLDAFAVTANRTLQPLSEIPQRIDVVSSETIETLQSYTFVDVLKKSSSVDVIQYPSGLAGVGIRGFRPETSGTNQHVLILVDGRPAGVTSLGNLPMVGIERVEVLRGPASSLYGSSAMGGVVNLITKRSKGSVHGTAQVGVGSFESYDGSLQAGGGNPDKVDFDVAVRTYQRAADYKLGNGKLRPNTELSLRSGYFRVGRNLGSQWRTDLRASGYLGRDVENPGAYTDGSTAQNAKDVDQFSFDLKVEGKLGAHTPQAALYRAHEYDKTHTESSGVTPYFSTLKNCDWSGLQVQDAWQVVEALRLTAGYDHQEVKSTTKSYNANGTRKTPTSPNDRQTTDGGFLEGIAKLFDDVLILNAGARYDRIKMEVLPTPFNTVLSPGAQSFDTFNPRAGIVASPFRTLKVHATAGRAFVAPSANQMAGSSDEVVSKQRRVVKGNPDLQPESSHNWDAGITWQTSRVAADITYFNTRVKNKIETVYTTNTTTYRETTYVNASTARQSGVEAKFDADLSSLLRTALSTWSIDLSATRMIDRDQNLPTGLELIRNVAKFKACAGLSWKAGPWRARISVRHVEGMWDADNSKTLIYTNGKGGTFEYSPFTTVDLFAARRFGQRHEVSVNVDNLSDQFYYEKGDYPQPGRTFFVRYKLSL